ncbi:MAG: thiolase family protein [Chloroflexi bacterium]|nr:thiolase family protein [Chloroflexota bacterium]MBU1880322.1 thiolase family protein [Chloroflexota bacterium]
MQEVVIVAAVRTPVGRHGGTLSTVRPDDLAALVIKEVVGRAGIAPDLVEDVVLGCTNQAGEDNRNVARMAAILAGLPFSVAGVTVNRLCASGLEAVNQAARAIKCGEGDVFIAGGVESMSRAPWSVPKTERAFPWGNVTMYDTTIGWRFPNPRMEQIIQLEGMGETAENIHDETGIGREEQDAFALESQRRAAAAIEAGRFKDEIVPVPIPQRKGPPLLVDTDEHPRIEIDADGRVRLATSAEGLARLRPAFRAGGSVTAGSSSGINDGAAALLLMSEAKARELGLKPLARWVTSAVAGVNPSTMGYGPIPATRKALDRAGLTVADLDLVELNEAFAVQALACIQELGLDPARTNVNGGAIALGHPLGCTGARLVVTLLHEMRRRAAAGEQMRYGLATLCVGIGQGCSTIFERGG